MVCCGSQSALINKVKRTCFNMLYIRCVLFTVHIIDVVRHVTHYVVLYQSKSINLYCDYWEYRIKILAKTSCFDFNYNSIYLMRFYFTKIIISVLQQKSDVM